MFWETELQGYMGTGIQGYRDRSGTQQRTWIQRYRDRSGTQPRTGIQRYRDRSGTQPRTGIQNHSETGPDTGIQRYRGPKIRGYSSGKDVLYLPKYIYKGIYLQPSPKQHRRLKVPQDIPQA